MSAFPQIATGQRTSRLVRFVHEQESLASIDDLVGAGEQPHGAIYDCINEISLRFDVE
jgi:hypothetical protein